MDTNFNFYFLENYDIYINLQLRLSLTIIYHLSNLTYNQCILTWLTLIPLK